MLFPIISKYEGVLIINLGCHERKQCEFCNVLYLTVLDLAHTQDAEATEIVSRPIFAERRGLNARDHCHGETTTLLGHSRAIVIAALNPTKSDA